LTGKDTYRDYVTGISAYLLQQLADSGDKQCVQGGSDVTWCSTEHNIDSYFSLSLAAYLTGNNDYRTAAGIIAAALRGPLWNTDTDRFDQGYGDSSLTLDVNSWGSVFLLSNDGTSEDENAVTRANSAMNAVQKSFYNSQVRCYRTCALHSILLLKTYSILHFFGGLNSSIFMGGCFFVGCVITTEN
jgi:hypothetical protein